MRAFICVELSEEAREEINKAIDKINESELIKAKFVEKENLHLTLKFLGEIDDKDVKIIKERLEKLNLRKFKVKLGKAGFFSPSFIKIIFIELLSDEIFQLQSEIEEALADLFPREKREFQSHVSIARVKAVKDREKFVEFIDKMKVKEIEFEVKSFKLKKSILTEEKPIYSDLLDFKLI
ncbi:MAG: RNA 2',3'-cyclic phosphodiesterase [Nanoarchaeota archaeon]